MEEFPTQTAINTQAQDPSLNPYGQLQVPEQFQGIIEKIPDPSDQEAFVHGITHLPESVQGSYFKRMGHTLNEKDEVTASSSRRGILYELRRIESVQAAGLETLDFEAARDIGEITYMGYSKKADINGAPDVELTSAVDCDVPLARNGEPYIYEVKSYARMPYGSKANSRNQVLKYERALEEGKAAGASIELKGRLDSQFMKWATGTEEAPSPIPGVEVLYTLDLPTGQEYTVVLKPGPEGKGLQFKNAEPVDELDQKVVAGILAAQADGSLVSVITADQAEAAPAEMQPFMKDPLSIKSADVFNDYEELRRVGMYDQLLAKTAQAISMEQAA